MTQYHNTIESDFDIKVMLLDDLDGVLERYGTTSERLTNSKLALKDLEKKEIVWRKLHNNVTSITKDGYSYVNINTAPWRSKIYAQIRDLKVDIEHDENDIKSLAAEWSEYEKVLALYGATDLIGFFEDESND